MDIVYTRPDLEAIVGSTNIGYIGFNKKATANDLHPGHEHLIQYCKSNFDATVVGFWDSRELINELFKLPHIETDIVESWDYDGCISWCNDKGVDIVLAPAFGYSATFFSNVGIDTSGNDISAYDFVNQVWLDNNYPSHDMTAADVSKFNNTMRAKMFVMVAQYKNQLNQTTIASWKDGEPTFIRAHFINNNKSESFEILDPVRTPENIYYSSTYFQMNSAQKSKVAQFEEVVDSVGYSDLSTLTAALNNIYEGLSVQRIDKMEGGLCGDNNDFLKIIYNIDGLNDVFPIYKKGVR